MLSLQNELTFLEPLYKWNSKQNLNVAKSAWLLQSAHETVEKSFLSLPQSSEEKSAP